MTDLNQQETPDQLRAQRDAAEQALKDSHAHNRRTRDALTELVARWEQQHTLLIHTWQNRPGPSGTYTKAQADVYASVVDQVSVVLREVTP